MATLNYTTSVAVAKTAGEIQDILARAGADAVAIQYVDRAPVGVSFLLDTPNGPRNFDLPVNVAGVQALLVRQVRAGQIRGGKSQAAWTSTEQAARVAWRIAKDWLEAQLAIIQAGMATLDQVMLPYLRVGDGQTLYQRYLANESRALEGSDD